MNDANNGSKLYLYSITTVAILGGLLFGYDTAVISGAEKGLEAFFLMATDFQYDNARYHFFQCTYRLCDRWCSFRFLRFPLGTTQFAETGIRAVLPVCIGILLSRIFILQLR